MSATDRKQDSRELWLRLKPSADRDIDEIADYLADEAGLETGLRFIEEAYQAFGLLADNPGVGWPCKSDNNALRTARMFRVSSRFESYLVLYRGHEGGIEILRVVHGSRDLPALFVDD
ncbi:MAG: type II toxin-antitoxin system RelE/ParE family toxin [Bryobacteraceae bacterium]